MGRALTGLWKSLFGLAPVAVLLLLPAGLAANGTWIWQRGLVFLAGYGAISTLGNVALAVWRPHHFEARDQSVVAGQEKGQPLADAVGSALLLVFGAVWVVLVPLDVFSLHLLPAPTSGIAVAGGVCALVGAALYPLAAWENQFATPNVQDQAERGQRVIDTGVYALIRHPIYLGNLLLVGGAALWLGSTAAALLGLAVILAFTIGRIRIEEAHLRAKLPGYNAYAERVRARLIPFLI